MWGKFEQLFNIGGSFILIHSFFKVCSALAIVARHNHRLVVLKVTQKDLFRVVRQRLNKDIFEVPCYKCLVTKYLSMALFSFKYFSDMNTYQVPEKYKNIWIVLTNV